MDYLSYRKLAAGILFQLLALFVRLKTCFCEVAPPANFVFGDSLVDVGNNNYIVSLSKANFVPNGIDFGKPTGRYTNGRTIVDILGAVSVLNYFSLLSANLIGSHIQIVWLILDDGIGS